MLTAKNDFNGDGISDILFTDPSGNLAIWELNATGAIIGGGVIGNPGPNWTYVATGDFNSDGKTDILFKGRDGKLAIWEMNGTAIIGGGVFDGPGPDWTVLGNGDYSNNSILFRNVLTGAYGSWVMNGTSVAGGGAFYDATGHATPVAPADFLYVGNASSTNYYDALIFREGNGYWEWTFNQYHEVDRMVPLGVPSAAYGGPAVFAGIGDFNGDYNGISGNGRTDLLFEDSYGGLSTWLMNGTTIIGGGPILVPNGTSWGGLQGVIATGDYNGDGTSDILRQLPDGTIVADLIVNNAVTSEVTIGKPGAGFEVAASPPAETYSYLIGEDLSTSTNYEMKFADNSLISGIKGYYVLPAAQGVSSFSPAGGETDVLLQSGGAGYPGFYYLAAFGEGPGAGGQYQIAPGSNWTAVALADFNGDRNSDVLFANSTTGVFAQWEFDPHGPGGVIGGGALGTPPPGYTFAAIGDFNGDGKSDILFRDTATGSLFAWFVDGTAITGGGTIANPGGTWQIKGTGDFDGDGKSDILFEDASGNYAIWDMHGTQIVGGGVLGHPGGTWQLAKITDLNNDGKSDLLFIDASGNYASWLMNDTVIIGGGAVSGIPSNIHLI